MEVEYPYLAQNGTFCGYKSNSAAVFVKDVVNITKGHERMLKTAVGSIKPVSVAFQVVPVALVQRHV